MKLRTATPASKSFHARIALVIISVVLLIAAPIGITGNVSADPYDEKIKALQAEIEAYNAEAAKLSEQAKTLQSAVAVLQSQANAIQAQINISQAKYDQLVIKIAETEKKIKDNQDALGVTIANMYVDDEISPLELLAGSRNISEYMDRQEYRASVRDELTSIIAEVKILKVELEKQKVNAKRVLDDRKNQKSALVAKQNEQQQLLNETRGQESEYQALVNTTREQIREARAAQALYYARLSNESSSVLLNGDPNKGGYPSYYANSPQDSLVDQWGMYNRECVSYTAWKVYQKYGNMPYWGGIGNAWQWAFSGWVGSGGKQVYYNSGVWHTANYIRYGIPAGSEPKVGSVAVSNGEYGHVAWVEAVDGDKITISQYNWYVPSLGGWGQYSEMVVNKNIFQKYIYFGEW